MRRIRPTSEAGSSGSAPRRAAVTVLVLVCLVVIALIGSTLLRTGLARRRRIQVEERRLQAGWLAEAGLERAAARLDEDPAYRGETWEVPAAELGGPWSGTVTIAVEPVAAQPSRRAVRVHADYPNRGEPRAREHRDAVMELGSAAREERR